MPKVTHNQTNFTAGELSPKLYGRVDIAKYANGAEIVENCIPLVQGGAVNRDGTRYITTAKLNNEVGIGLGDIRKTRLVSFIYNRDQAYILEFGHLYLRFYRNNAPIMKDGDPTTVYEITTPFSESTLDDLDFAQQFDTLIIAHRDIETQRLRRNGDEKWEITTVPFVSVPTAETGYTPYSLAKVDTYPTAGGALVAGASVNVRSIIHDEVHVSGYVDGNAFLKSDVGRFLRIQGGGTIKIEKYIDKSNVRGTIKGFPAGLAGPQIIAAGNWILDGSPQATLAPSAKGPIGSEITLTAGAAGTIGSPQAIVRLFNCPSQVTPLPANTCSSYGCAIDYGGASLVGETFLCAGMSAAASSGFKVGDLVALTDFESDEGDKNFNGMYKVHYKFVYGSYTKPSEIAGDASIEAALVFSKKWEMNKMTDDIALIVTTGTVTKTTAGKKSIESFREYDEGGVVRINGGAARITDVVTPSQVKAEVIKELSSTVKAVPNSWVLQLPCWNESLGYPGAVTIAGQRLILAGSRRYPNAVWMSSIAEYFNFDVGTVDTDAIDARISSKEMADIVHLADNNGIVVLARNAEFTILGGVEKPITPTNIQIKSQSAFGSGDCSPVKVGSETMFVQRGNKKIRAMSYQYGSDSYSSPDITALADHLVINGIRSIAYQQEPYSILWIVTKTGQLVSCTMDREQNVIAWARHSSGDALFESVACIPSGDLDQVWLTVLRKDNLAPLP